MVQIAQEGMAIIIYLVSAFTILVYAVTTVFSVYNKLAMSIRLSLGSSLYTAVEKLDKGDCIRLYLPSRRMDFILNQLNGSAAVTVEEHGDYIEICKRV